MADRSRSRSPAPKSQEKKSSGFKWKNNSSTRPSERRERDDRDGPRQDRSYRERSPRYDAPRSYHNDQDRASRRDGPRHRDDDRRRSPGRRDDARDDRNGRDGYGRGHRDDDRRANGAGDAQSRRPQQQDSSKPPERPAAREQTKVKKLSRPAEPMIIVNVNDRLGTKAAIPCLGSDPISKYQRVISK